jgi:hypothetical protein
VDSPRRTLVAAARPPVIQMRRIPPNIHALLTATSGGQGANFGANEAGALRLVGLAMEELTPAERAAVNTTRLGGLTETQFNALTSTGRVITTPTYWASPKSVVVLVSKA